MKRLILTLVLALFTAGIASAQNYEDVVYLKNGSVIRGMIVEQVPGTSYKIKTSNGSVILCDADEVTKICKEQSAWKTYSDNQPVGTKNAKGGKGFNRPVGYMFLVDVQIPTYFLGAVAAGVDVITGYRVLPQFAVGVGTGFECNLETQAFQMPFFVHVRSDFLNRSCSPFVAFNLGFNQTYNDWHTQTGFFMKPQVGVGFNVGQRSRLYAGLDCKITMCDASWGKADKKGNEKGKTPIGIKADPWYIGLLGVNVGISF